MSPCSARCSTESESTATDVRPFPILHASQRVGDLVLGTARRKCPQCVAPPYGSLSRVLPRGRASTRWHSSWAYRDANREHGRLRSRAASDARRRTSGGRAWSRRIGDLLRARTGIDPPHAPALGLGRRLPGRPYWCRRPPQHPSRFGRKDAGGTHERPWTTRRRRRVTE